MFRGFLIFLMCTACYLDVQSQVVKVNVTAYPAPGTTTPDTVYYSRQRKLNWDDFRGRVRAASSSAAVTFTGFLYTAASIQQKDTIHVRVILQTYFDRTASWVRPDHRNAYALSHEQLHFDIAKLVADRFKDTLLSSTFSPDYYAGEIDFLYWDYWRKMTDLEMQFDRETHHGILHSTEALWQKKIRKALLSGSDPGLPHDE